MRYLLLLALFASSVWASENVGKATLTVKEASSNNNVHMPSPPSPDPVPKPSPDEPLPPAPQTDNNHHMVPNYEKSSAK